MTVDTANVFIGAWPNGTRRHDWGLFESSGGRENGVSRGGWTDKYVQGVILKIIRVDLLPWNESMESRGHEGMTDDVENGTELGNVADRELGYTRTVYDF